jgi:hypothetical protein
MMLFQKIGASLPPEQPPHAFKAAVVKISSTLFFFIIIYPLKNRDSDNGYYLQCYFW